MKVWKMNLLFVSGWFSGEPSEFFRICLVSTRATSKWSSFRRVLQRAVGSRPWDIYSTLENLPIWGILSEQKPLKSTNLHQKLRVWKHQFFDYTRYWDIHWSLVFVKMGMRVNSPFNKNCGQMKGGNYLGPWNWWNFPSYWEIQLPAVRWTHIFVSSP